MKTTYTIKKYISENKVGKEDITSFKHNIFLHKSHTGQGGTTAYLKCDKNVIIISPNTGMVISKEDSDPDDAIYIHGTANGKWSEATEKVKQGQIVKVNATWASLQNIAKNDTLFKDITELFHLVVDECHCIYDGFKQKPKKNEQPLLPIPELILKFKTPWVITTATPMKFDTTLADARTVFFESTKPKEDLTIVVAENENQDVSDLLAVELQQIGTMVATNNNQYATLYPSKHQILASEKFKIKANKNNALQISNKTEVDQTCDYVQLTTRYNTGFDVYGEWKAVVVAENNTERDINIDSKTHQQIRQALGRLRELALTNVIIWKSVGQHRNLSEIERDIKQNPTVELIREYALAETYGDLDRFVEIMEGYGYNVTIERKDNLNSVRNLSLIKGIHHILENGNVVQMTTTALKYIKGDNRDNIGLAPTVIIAHMIANLIHKQVINLDQIKLISSQPARIYEKVLKVINELPQYEMYRDFMAIHLYNNKIKSILSNDTSKEFKVEKRRVEIYTRAYNQINKNLAKHSKNINEHKEAKLVFNATDILRNAHKIAEDVAKTDEDKKICKKLTSRLSTKVKKSINENKTIRELSYSLQYRPAQIINKWIADNMFLFCKKYNLPTNHFRVTRTGHREYNPLTKAETWTRFKVPIDTEEYDVKEAYPKFIDAILGITVGEGIYDRIKESLNISRAEAKVYYNTLINSHHLSVAEIEDRLKQIGYDDKSIKWLAPNIRANNMHTILTEMESEVIAEFAELFAGNFVRLHDAIVTFKPANKSIQDHFKAKGIEFGGQFESDGFNKAVALKNMDKEITELLNNFHRKVA